MFIPLLRGWIAALAVCLFASIALAVGCATAAEEPPQPTIAQVVADIPSPTPSTTQPPAATDTPFPPSTATPLPTATPAPIPTATPTATLTPNQQLADIVQSVEWIQSNAHELVFLDSRCPHLSTQLRAKASVVFDSKRPLTQMAYQHYKGEAGVYTEYWQRRIPEIETDMRNIIRSLHRQGCR